MSAEAGPSNVGRSLRPKSPTKNESTDSSSSDTMAKSPKNSQVISLYVCAILSLYSLVIIVPWDDRPYSTYGPLQTSLLLHLTIL